MKSKWVLIVLLTAGLLLGCMGNNHTESNEAVKNVKIVSPVLMSNIKHRTLPGVVKASNEMNIGFKTAGQISRFLVHEGDFVKEGDVIAELDRKDYLLQLEASQIQYDQLKAEVERLEVLFKRNNIAANDYEKALAGLSALSIQLQADKNTIEYTVLRSPVSGYIQAVNFSKSEMVGAGTAVVRLIDLSTVKVEAELPASLYMRKNDFITYSCQTNLIQNEEVPLKVLGINQKSNSSQLHKISFVPESPNSGLIAGMNVKVVITIDDSKNIKGTAYTLPLKTVFSEKDKSYVWVVENNTVKKRNIQIGGISSDGAMIILSGISENDKIVKAGIRVLNENDKVNIIPEPEKTNVGGLL